MSTLILRNEKIKNNEECNTWAAGCRTDVALTAMI